MVGQQLEPSTDDPSMARYPRRAPGNNSGPGVSFLIWTGNARPPSLTALHAPTAASNPRAFSRI